MEIRVASKNLIILQDVNNDKIIKTFDITNVEGKLIGYPHRYFSNYKQYISYLLKMGAVVNNEEDTCLQTHNRIIPINEIPVIKYKTPHSVK